MPLQKQYILFLIIDKQTHFSEVLDDVLFATCSACFQAYSVEARIGLGFAANRMPNDTSGLRVIAKAAAAPIKPILDDFRLYDSISSETNS